MPQRYKVQQDQGKYCLKGCDDGDLVDWSAYEALQRELEHREKYLAQFDLVPKPASALETRREGPPSPTGVITCAECEAVQPPGGTFHMSGCSSMNR